MLKVSKCCIAFLSFMRFDFANVNIGVVPQC